MVSRPRAHPRARGVVPGRPPEGDREPRRAGVRRDHAPLLLGSHPVPRSRPLAQRPVERTCDTAVGVSADPLSVSGGGGRQQDGVGTEPLRLEHLARVGASSDWNTPLPRQVSRAHCGLVGDQSLPLRHPLLLCAGGRISLLCVALGGGSVRTDARRATPIARPTAARDLGILSTRRSQPFPLLFAQYAPDR